MINIIYCTGILILLLAVVTLLAFYLIKDLLPKKIIIDPIKPQWVHCWQCHKIVPNESICAHCGRDRITGHYP